MIWLTSGAMMTIQLAIAGAAAISIFHWLRTRHRRVAAHGLTLETALLALVALAGVGGLAQLAGTLLDQLTGPGLTAGGMAGDNAVQTAGALLVAAVVAAWSAGSALFLQRVFRGETPFAGFPGLKHVSADAANGGVSGAQEPLLEKLVAQRTALVREELADCQEELRQLRQKSRMLETLVSNSPVILWSVDAEGTITMSEGKGLAGQGRRPGELVGQSCFQVYEKSSGFVEDVQRGLNGERFSSIRETDGATYERWFEPLRDEQGQVTGLIGVSLDITSRLETERELRKKSRLLETLVTKAPVILWSLDRDGTITVSEGKGLKGQGLEAGELVGRSVFEVYRDQPDMIDSARKALNGESVSGVREILGSHYERRIEPICDAAGRVEGVIGVSIDITERVRAERDLRASQRLLRTVVDTVPHSIFVKEPDGRFAMANSAMAATHDLRPDEVVGKYNHELPNCTPEENDQLTNIDRQVVETLAPVQAEEIALTRPDGTKTWRRMFKAPLFDDDGNLEGIVGISENITDRRELRINLKEREERVRALLDAATAGFILLDRDLVVRDCNLYYERRRGRSKDQIIGRPVRDIVTEEEANRRVPIYEEVLRTRKPVGFEDVIYMPGHPIEAANFQVFPVGDGIGVLAFNVSKQKQTEADLRANRALLQTVFDAIPHSMAVVDSAQRLLKVNRAWQEFHGVPEDAAVGSTVAELNLPPCASGTLAVPSSDGNDSAVGIAEEEAACRDHAGAEHVLQTIRAPILDALGGTGCVSISMDVTERRRAELEQTRERLLFRTVLDSIPLRIIVRDASGARIVVNRALAELYGQTPDEFLELEKSDYVAQKELWTTLAAEERDVLTHGTALQVERTIKLPNGREEFNLINKVPLRDSDGSVRGVVVIAQDITERRRAEEEQSRERLLFRTVLDSIPSRIVVRDKSGKRIAANKAIADVFGLTPAEFLRLKGKYPLATRKEWKKLDAQEQDVIRNGKHYQFERTIQLPNGKMESGLITKVPLRDPDGSTRGVVVIGQDITERKQAEQALAESRNLLRTVIDAVPHIISVKGLDGRTILVNDALAAEFGVTPDAMIGKTAYDAPGRPSELSDLETVHDQEVTSSGKPVLRENVLRPRRDGSEGIYNIYKAPLLSELGDVKGIIAVGQDITEAREMELRAEEGHQLLRSVVDMVPQLISLRETQGNYVLVNKAMGDYFSLEPRNSASMSLATLPGLDPSALAALNEMDRRVVQEKKAIFGEVIHPPLKPGARETVFHVFRGPIFDDQGEVTRILGVSTDVTLTKDMEEQVRESRNLLRTVIDTVPQIIDVKDLDGRYVMANTAAGNALGIPPQDVVGKTVSTLPGLSAGQVEIVKEMDRTVLEGGSSARVDGTLPKGESGGIEGIYHVFKAPLLNEDGTTGGIVTVAQDITEAKRMEGEIRESRNLLRTVIDTVPHMINVKGLDGRFVLANKAMADFFMTDTDEIVGRATPSLSQLPRAIVDELERMDRHVIEHHSPVLRDGVVGPKPDGSKGIFHIYKAPLLSEAGELSGIVAVSLEITESKLLEQRLEEGQNLLRTVIDSVPNTIFVKGLDGRYLLVNKPMGDFFGIKPEAFVGMSHADLPNQRAGLKGELSTQDREVLQARAPISFENLMNHRSDGALRTFQMYKTPLFADDGAPRAILGIGQDVTESREMERDLKEGRALLQTVFDSMPHWVFVKDVERRYRMINNAMAEEFSVAPGDVVGLQMIDQTSTPDSEMALMELTDEEVLTTGQRVTSAEYTCSLPDGRQQTRHLIKLPWLDSEGNTIGIVGVSEDISERKAMEDQLRQAQKMEAVGQLAGGVAHDFNNMLQIIQGYTELAILNSQDQGPDVSSLERVLGSAKRASNLTRQLLAFSRRQVMQAETVVVSDLIDNLLKMLGRLIGESIVFKVTHGHPGAAVSADAGMLEQVLMNLCVNARDAMPDGGMLSIETGAVEVEEEAARELSLARPGPYVTIQVRDTGMGISREDVAHVFEPFFTTKEPGKGTGLGLSVVYGIVKQHEGRIAVSSTEGKGTVFTIYLPATRDSSARAPETATEKLARGTETILVAEDEEDLLEMIRTLLEEQGYQVLSASDGEEACAVYRDHADAIDLVILDAVMPKVSGRKACEQIREWAPSVPIVFSTGYSSNVLDAEFLAKSRTALLRKPYSPELLCRVIREQLDGSRTSTGGHAKAVSE